MELVTLGKEMLQTVAEHGASYRIGQTTLRHIDRALWVIEKCARWAVPPPLDQDERPQPELVRPLPWVFFLALLVALRITRESISIINLVIGKPPLRSADVVTYIQGKRRYLRALKYQGHRTMRARATAPSRPWMSGAHSLLDFTMCFRRPYQYGNNNTTSVSNNDEVLVVKRSKRGRTSPGPSTNESMERLIEKMMVDLDADSDDDSSFTLTNAKSERSETTGSDNDTVLENESPLKNKESPKKSDYILEENPNSSTEIGPRDASTPTKPSKSDMNDVTFTENQRNLSEPKEEISIVPNNTTVTKEYNEDTTGILNREINTDTFNKEIAESSDSTTVETNTEPQKDLENKDTKVALSYGEEYSKVTDTKYTIEESQNFLQNEKKSPPKSQPAPKKIGTKILDIFQPKRKVDGYEGALSKMRMFNKKNSQIELTGLRKDSNGLENASVITNSDAGMGNI